MRTVKQIRHLNRRFVVSSNDPASNRSSELEQILEVWGYLRSSLRRLSGAGPDPVLLSRLARNGLKS